MPSRQPAQPSPRAAALILHSGAAARSHRSGGGGGLCAGATDAGVCRGRPCRPAELSAAPAPAPPATMAPSSPQEASHGRGERQPTRVLPPPPQHPTAGQQTGPLEAERGARRVGARRGGPCRARAGRTSPREAPPGPRTVSKAPRSLPGWRTRFPRWAQSESSLGPAGRHRCGPGGSLGLHSSGPAAGSAPGGPEVRAGSVERPRPASLCASHGPAGAKGRSPARRLRGWGADARGSRSPEPDRL